MTTSNSPRLDSSQVAVRLGLCAAALAGMAAPVSDANAVVVTFSTPIPVPATFEGVYINLLTGANAPTTAGVPGWDFGPWGTSTLNFFWNNAVANSAGGVAAASVYSDLAPGSVISGASVFSASAGAAAAAVFQTTGTHTLGFKFFNESTAAVNFGYLTMTSTGPLGHPAVVTGWSFENSGGAITVAAVPEASTTAMFSLGALALGAMNLRKLRRSRKLAS